MEIKADGSASFLRDLSVQGSLNVRGSDVLSFSGPVGTIFPYAGTLSSLPENFSLCDGKELSKNDGFLELYSVIGTKWGGNGTPFFNIPNLCGYYLRGSNNVSTVGRTQEQDFQKHNHDLTFNPKQSEEYTSSTIFGGKGFLGIDCTTGYSNDLTGSFGTGDKIGSATEWNGTWIADCDENAPNAQETRPKTAFVNFILKTKLSPTPTIKKGDDETGLDIDEEGNVIVSGDLNVLNSLAINGEFTEELIPVGSVLFYAGYICNDKNFKFCDGSIVSNDEFPELQKAIGHTWGGSDLKFRLPSLSCYFLRGVSGDSDRDPDRDTRTMIDDGANSGNKIGSYQRDAIENHQHLIFFKSGESNKKATFGWLNFLGINLTTGYADELTDSFGTGEARPDASNKTDRWKAGWNVNCNYKGSPDETNPKNKWVNYLIKVSNTSQQKITDSKKGFSVDGKGNTTFFGNVNLLGSLKIKGSLIEMFPIGFILPYAGPCEKTEQIPRGFLLCNGNAKSTFEFSRLYSIIGGIWGENKDKKEFNLPDFRGRFLRGVEKNTQNLGSYWNDSLKGHKHDVTVNPISTTGFTTTATVGGLNLGSLNATTNYSRWERGYFGTGGPRPKLSNEKGQQDNKLYKEWRVGWSLTCSDPVGARTSKETRCINAYINFIIKY